MSQDASVAGSEAPTTTGGHLAADADLKEMFQVFVDGDRVTVNASGQFRGNPELDERVPNEIGRAVVRTLAGKRLQAIGQTALVRVFGDKTGGLLFDLNSQIVR